MSFDLGLNVVEVDGRATPSIQPAATSVTGFVIRSQRGVAGEVVRVTNWSQFLERFGSYLRGAYGAYAVRGFFDNGGATAYIDAHSQHDRRHGHSSNHHLEPGTLAVGARRRADALTPILSGAPSRRRLKQAAPC